MIPGPNHDDAYRMVEDEFLSVAGDFTRHLHAAEYHRLKSLAAKSHHADDAISTISRRPLAALSTGEGYAGLGGSTARPRRRRRILKTQGGYRGDGSSSDDEQDDCKTASSLRDLMDSPRKTAVRLGLGGLPKQPSFGRVKVEVEGGGDDGPPARGGTKRARTEEYGDDEEEEEDDSDDLDGEVGWSPSYGARTVGRYNPGVKDEPVVKREEASALPNIVRIKPDPDRQDDQHYKPSGEEGSTIALAADDYEDDDFLSRIRRRRSAGHTTVRNRTGTPPCPDSAPVTGKPEDNLPISLNKIPSH